MPLNVRYRVWTQVLTLDWLPSLCLKSTFDSSLREQVTQSLRIQWIGHMVNTKNTCAVNDITASKGRYSVEICGSLCRVKLYWTWQSESWDPIQKPDIGGYLTLGCSMHNIAGYLKIWLISDTKLKLHIVRLVFWLADHYCHFDKNLA